jgi:hypothetical protein
MFAELVRADKACAVTSRPKLLVTDNQTGYVQVGQDVPYVASSDIKDGMAVQTIEYRPVGVTMRLTPRVSADGRSVLVRTELQHSAVTPTPVDLGGGLQSPAFNIQTCQTTVLIPDGGTVVIRFGSTQTADGKGKTDHLWMLTPSVVRGKDAKPLVVPPQPAPANVMEPRPFVDVVLPNSVQVHPRPTPAQAPLPANGTLPPGTPKPPATVAPVQAALPHPPIATPPPAKP